MSSNKYTFILFLCMGMAACSNKLSQPTTIHFETIHSSAFCKNATTSGVSIMRHTTFSNSINPDQASRAQTETDNTDKTKIQINMGRFNTAGYSLEVTSATATNGVLKLMTHWNEPAADAMLAQVITQPCVIISLQQQALEHVQVFDQHGKLRISQQLLTRH